MAGYSNSRPLSPKGPIVACLPARDAEFWNRVNFLIFLSGLSAC